VPADHKWFARVVIGSAFVSALGALDPSRGLFSLLRPGATGGALRETRRVNMFGAPFTARSERNIKFRVSRRPLMRLLLGTVAAAGSLALAIAAFAQSTPAPATAVPAQSNPSPAVPVPLGKRLACQTASQGLKGQEQRDQMQLCVAQAQLDCLKQAIDQKIVGPQRRDFVRSCMQ
jgi:hypothetical protein